MGKVLPCFIKNPLVEKNEFLTQKRETAKRPTFARARKLLPDPYWDNHESAIACYWKAWELAFGNLLPATDQNGFVSPFISTAFNGNLFMWDSVFNCQFGRYGSRVFNFQGTLDNFYRKQNPDGFISREISETDGSEHFQRHDPSSTGPNVLGWGEWEYFLNFGDTDRLRRVYHPLLAFHQWMKKYRSWPDGGYWTSGWGCGMDNQPRQPDSASPAWDHGHMTWIDATAQALLSAKTLLKMAAALGIADGVSELKAEAKSLTAYLNQSMWSERLGFYVDRFRDGSLSKLKTIGAYWLLLADAVPPQRIERFLKHLENPKEFNRPHRVPSLSADHPAYVKPHGDYWNGGVWPSTNYMLLRGLTSIGRDDLAYAIGLNHHQAVIKVFETTGTVWENYAPESMTEGKPAKNDFVGWGGVPPIAGLFEYVFGLRPIASRNRLVWDIRSRDAFGVNRYPFGSDGLLDLSCESRASDRDKPVVSVSSNHRVDIDVRWPGGSYRVKAGQ
ncbi:MAG: trehalase family glycosidase [Planctomycetota bacterium]